MMRLKVIGLFAMGALSLAVAGCHHHDKTEPAPIQKPAAEQPKAEQPKPAAVAQRSGMITQRAYFPTGEEGNSLLLVEKSIPAELSAGKAGAYEIKVTNISDLTLNDVSVKENVPAGATVTGTNVNVKGAGAADLAIGTLKPGESKTVQLQMTAAEAGNVTMCSTASFTPVFCMTNQVISPDLKVTAEGPAEALLCEPFKYTIVVSNPGVGMARGVKVTQALPQGLATVEGRNAVTIEVGDLAAKESKSYAVNVKAARTGSYSTKASAAAGQLAAESGEVKTVVKQPVLAITKTGTAKAFAGQVVTYDITVTNKGDAVAKNTVVSDAIPAGTQFARATEGGTNAAGKVTWNVGDLQPGASKKVSATFTVGAIGQVQNTASATAVCAEAVSATAASAVAGIPAILLEVVDSPDPVLVGDQTTYSIRVTNQGSAPGTNITVNAEVEAAGQIVASGGDAQGKVAGNKATFGPIASLAPKASMTFTVTVKAVKEADSRFSVQMTSDQIDRPVSETEATNFYQ